MPPHHIPFPGQVCSVCILPSGLGGASWSHLSSLQANSKWWICPQGLPSFLQAHPHPLTADKLIGRMEGKCEHRQLIGRAIKDCFKPEPSEAWGRVSSLRLGRDLVGKPRLDNNNSSNNRDHVILYPGVCYALCIMPFLIHAITLQSRYYYHAYLPIS